MRSEILKEIESANCITIYRHQFPDMDAFGSQFGLATWIRDTYPNKQVYCLGQTTATGDKLGIQMDEANDQVIASSLAIILDTANADRVDDDRFKTASKSIRIDHHVQTETMCDIEWIETKATAACEMLALLFASNDIKISAKAAQYLYCGLTADNIRFSISSVRPESFEAARYLLTCGVDVVKADLINYSISYSDFEYETKVRAKAIKNENSLISIMEREDYQSCGQTFSSAKEKVYALSGVEGITCWGLFTRMENSEKYNASLRARTLDIRHIAQQYGGGGHKCASGIKNLTIEQVHEIQELLAKTSTESE